jgi:hypothetical protein
MGEKGEEKQDEQTEQNEIIIKEEKQEKVKNKI